MTSLHCLVTTLSVNSFHLYADDALFLSSPPPRQIPSNLQWLPGNVKDKPELLAAHHWQCKGKLFVQLSETLCLEFDPIFSGMPAQPIQPQAEFQKEINNAYFSLCNTFVLPVYFCYPALEYLVPLLPPLVVPVSDLIDSIWRDCDLHFTVLPFHCAVTDGIFSLLSSLRNKSLTSKTHLIF